MKLCINPTKVLHLSTLKLRGQKELSCSVKYDRKTLTHISHFPEATHSEGIFHLSPLQAVSSNGLNLLQI